MVRAPAPRPPRPGDGHRARSHRRACDHGGRRGRSSALSPISCAPAAISPRLDASVGGWANDHAVAWSTQLIQFVTDLASTPAAILVLLVVIVVEMIRAPNRWVASVPDHRSRRRGAARQHRQAAPRSRPPHLQPCRRDPRPLVPERALRDRGGALCLGRAGAGAEALARVAALLAGGAAGIAVGVATSRVMLTCTGYPTSSPVSPSAGRGSRSARRLRRPVPQLRRAAGEGGAGRGGAAAVDRRATPDRSALPTRIVAADADAR